MPYRRLPNTDSARLRALKKAIEMSKEIPPFRLAFSMKTLVRIQAFLPLFENTISHQKQTLNNQTEKAKSNQDTARKARLYLTHFLKVMNMAVARGELQPETRSFYGIAADDATIPSLTTENELVAWGKRIIDGEEYRIRKGNMPVMNPTIAVVKVRYEKFLESRTHYKTINRRATECINRTSEMRREADELIATLWNEIEAGFASLPEEEKRAGTEKYGVIYVFRKNETARQDLSPTLFSVNQENQ
jgi:beta-glucosidase-like glycosyl hydrolase